jgi:hypothetical protein
LKTSAAPNCNESWKLPEPKSSIRRRPPRAPHESCQGRGSAEEITVYKSCGHVVQGLAGFG